MRRSEPSSNGAGRPPHRMLYLLTDELSSVLVRGQLAFMADHGFEVAVAARLGNPTRPATDRWDDAAEVHHLPFVREPSPGSDVRALVATVRLIRRVRPDVVHASTPKAGLLGMIAARICRVPVRVTVVRGLRSETATGWTRRFVQWSEMLTMRLATDVVFNSASLRRLAETDGLIGQGHGVVFGHGSGNGIDVDRFAPERSPVPTDARSALGLPTDALVVGFVGRLTHDKGIDDLVAVFDDGLRARNVWLLLVGQFEPGDPLDPTTMDQILAGRQVVLVPWLDDPTVAYAAMEVLAFPSYREGLPNVVLEAQASRVPVVGYAATGTVDAVNDATATLVPVGDIGALRRALTTVLDDPAERARRGDAAHDWVAAQFDSHRVWSALAEMIAHRSTSTGNAP